MSPRTRTYPDLENEDVPARDRPYESFGQQGVALATYGDEPFGHEPGTVRGAERVDLGEQLVGPEPPRGAGPRGWARRDDRIHEDVCMRLTEDGFVDASDIEVIVHHGEVALSGSVADRSQRERAIRVAESVRGVIDVIVRLRVDERATAAQPRK